MVRRHITKTSEQLRPCPQNLLEFNKSEQILTRRQLFKIIKQHLNKRYSTEVIRRRYWTASYKGSRNNDVLKPVSVYGILENRQEYKSSIFCCNASDLQQNIEDMILMLI